MFAVAAAHMNRFVHKCQMSKRSRRTKKGRVATNRNAVETTADGDRQPQQQQQQQQQQ